MPKPAMPPMPSGLKAPPTVYPPTQISLGSQVYYQVCMACHGDRGQGLTDEWRGQLDLPDQNCWQSKCHAANHPPGGFVFPKVVPAVVSPAVIYRFNTALDLYQFIKTKMPFQAPGSLKDEEYWQLTAFLVQANGIDLGQRTLDLRNAAQVTLHPPTPAPLPAQVAGAPSGFSLVWLGVGAGLVFVVLIFLVQWSRRHS